MTRPIFLAGVCGILLAWSIQSLGHGPTDRQVPPSTEKPAASAPAPFQSNSARGGEVHAHHEMGGADPGANVMEHPGLPRFWIVAAVAAMAVIAFWSLFAPRSPDAPARSVNLAAVPAIGAVVRFLNATPYPLAGVKLVSVSLFLIVVAAGLVGTPHPEHNLATVLTWNLWWPLVVVSVFFLGSAWCAVCPWDTLSSWIVRRRLWGRANPHPGLNLKVPTYLRNVWLALLLLMGFTWLELGADFSAIPFATALMALLMLLLSLVFLLVFERKAFCRFACPVGRTLGFYSRLAPVALRPADQPTCDRCRTLECFNGSERTEPCPTHLTMRGLDQNTYCLSCGNCVLSCPYHNVSWRLRPMGTEAKERARPRWDEAWFMLALLGITSFHGLTMLPVWGDWTALIAKAIGDSGHLLASFTLSMLAAFAAPALVYAAAIGWAHISAMRGVSYRQLFTGFAFTALPLAFAYHLAHNLGHLSRESGDFKSVFASPLGLGLDPLSVADRHERMMNVLIPDQVLFALQAGLLVLGFWLAVRIARNRIPELLGKGSHATAWRLLPMLAFASVITGMSLWLMSRDMVVRF